MKNQEIIHYIGIILIISTMWAGLTLFEQNGKHYEDKGYRLCISGIRHEQFTFRLLEGCLEKYGVEIQDNQ